MTTNGRNETHFSYGGAVGVALPPKGFTVKQPREFRIAKYALINGFAVALSVAGTAERIIVIQQLKIKSIITCFRYFLLFFFVCHFLYKKLITYTLGFCPEVFSFLFFIKQFFIKGILIPF